MATCGNRFENRARKAGARWRTLGILRRTRRCGRHLDATWMDNCGLLRRASRSRTVARVQVEGRSTNLGKVGHMITCKSKVSPRPASGADSGLPAASVTGRTASKPIRLLRLAQVKDMTGLGRTKIYELQAAGRFPMRVQITDHSVGWVEEEVQAWLARRVAARPALAARSAALRAVR